MSDKEFRKEVANKFSSYHREITNETDRGSIIVTAVILENNLQKLLEKKLLPPAKKSDKLFDSPYAPLSNFSAKIDITYRLGLIPDQTRESLHLIRKIRNDFAHKRIEDGFKNSSVKSRISEIFKLNKTILIDIWDFLKDTLIEKLNLNKERFEDIKSVKPLVEVLNWRRTFNLLAAVTCVALIYTFEDIEPLSPLEKPPEET